MSFETNPLVIINIRERPFAKLNNKSYKNWVYKERKTTYNQGRSDERCGGGWDTRQIRDFQLPTRQTQQERLRLFTANALTPHMLLFWDKPYMKYRYKPRWDNQNHFVICLLRSTVTSWVPKKKLYNSFRNIFSRSSFWAILTVTSATRLWFKTECIMSLWVLFSVVYIL